jgi:hypothetical protein
VSRVPEEKKSPMIVIVTDNVTLTKMNSTEVSGNFSFQPSPSTVRVSPMFQYTVTSAMPANMGPIRPIVFQHPNMTAPNNFDPSMIVIIFQHPGAMVPANISAGMFGHTGTMIPPNIESNSYCLMSRKPYFVYMY